MRLPSSFSQPHSSHDILPFSLREFVIARKARSYSPVVIMPLAAVTGIARKARSYTVGAHLMRD